MLGGAGAAVALHFAFYEPLSCSCVVAVTPAMQARVTDHIWDLAELISGLN